MAAKQYGEYRGPYPGKSVKARIRELFLDNLGLVVDRTMIIAAATDPKTGKEPENWHQRLSELRTDEGFTILSRRDRQELGNEEYLMPDATQRETAGKRVKPTAETWQAVLHRADHSCEWEEASGRCALANGEIDPVGGGTVRLTADHKQPHAVNPNSDPTDPDQWQALCGRHQVVKKNYWDDTTGKLNSYAVVQAAKASEKRQIFEFLADYFGYEPQRDGSYAPKGP